MKIKQLEWEDCIPTISSSVVSRARGIGIEYWIYGEADALCLSEVEMAFSKSRGMGPARSVASIEDGKRLGQELFEARIREVVEVKAAEIRWHKDSNVWRGDEKEYTIWMYGDKYKAGTKVGGDVGDKLLYDTLEEAKAACQDHKQSKLEKLLCPSR